MFVPAFAFASPEIPVDMEQDVPTYTGNPNECWVQNEDGTLEPCKIEGGLGIGFLILVLLHTFWPVILAASSIIVGVYLYRKKKTTIV